MKNKLQIRLNFRDFLSDLVNSKSSKSMGNFSFMVSLTLIIQTAKYRLVIFGKITFHGLTIV